MAKSTKAPETDVNDVTRIKIWSANSSYELSTDLMPHQIVGELQRCAEKNQFYQLGDVFLNTKNIERLEVLQVRSIKPVINIPVKELSLEERQLIKQPTLKQFAGVVTHENSTI